MIIIMITANGMFQFDRMKQKQPTKQEISHLYYNYIRKYAMHERCGRKMANFCTKKRYSLIFIKILWNHQIQKLWRKNLFNSSIDLKTQQNLSCYWSLSLFDTVIFSEIKKYFRPVPPGSFISLESCRPDRFQEKSFSKTLFGDFHTI